MNELPNPAIERPARKAAQAAHFYVGHHQSSLPARTIITAAFHKFEGRYRVYKIILLVSLLATACSAWAGWFQVINFNSDANVYADAATIKTTGDNRVSMAVLHDLTKLNTIGSGASAISFRSTKYLQEFDCKNGQTRNLSGTLFSGNMGQGTELMASDMRKLWSAAADHPTDEALWKIACGKY